MIEQDSYRLVQVFRFYWCCIVLFVWLHFLLDFLLSFLWHLLVVRLSNVAVKQVEFLL